MSQEQYAAGYRRGLDGRKAPKDDDDPDLIRGYHDGAADRRYNQRAKQHNSTFKHWSERLPGQMDLY